MNKKAEWGITLLLIAIGMAAAIGWALLIDKAVDDRADPKPVVIAQTEPADPMIDLLNEFYEAQVDYDKRTIAALRKVTELEERSAPLIELATAYNSLAEILASDILTMKQQMERIQPYADKEYPVVDAFLVNCVDRLKTIREISTLIHGRLQQLLDEAQKLNDPKDLIA